MGRKLWQLKAKRAGTLSIKVVVKTVPVPLNKCFWNGITRKAEMRAKAWNTRNI